MSLKYVRLDYLGDDFAIIVSPSVKESRKIIFYIEEFKNQIAICDPPINVWPESYDAELFWRFKKFYQKIGKFFDIEVEQLKEKSRHHFFIGTEPVKIKNNIRIGLSLIEQLLGFDYPKDAAAIEIDNLTTTGDPFLDITTHALLIFKVADLNERFSLEDLHKMCKLAGDLQDRATKEDSKQSINNDLDSEPEHEDFIKNKAKIMNTLQSLGITIPAGF